MKGCLRRTSRGADDNKVGRVLERDRKWAKALAFLRESKSKPEVAVSVRPRVHNMSMVRMALKKTLTNFRMYGSKMSIVSNRY